MHAQCPSCQEPLPDDASFRFCPACAAPLAAQDPLLGRVLAGRYRVLSVLGEGGMGRVYVAEQTLVSTARRVALKILLPELAGDERITRRFLDEIGLVAGLEHPNTVRVLDAGRADGGQVYVAMELLRGQPLSRALAGGLLEPARIEHIVRQICASLSEAHGKGIVHRDLKPDNVMLCEIGGEPDVVKVLDFGIARLLGGLIDEPGPRPRITRRGEVLGTPEYMSPERFGISEGDARSDIYSLGVMAYEMGCGRLPFQAGGLAQWAILHASAAPAPFESTAAGAALPLAMKRAIARALSKRPEDRQQSARELSAELRGSISMGAPPSASAGARPGPTFAAAPLGTADELDGRARRSSGTMLGEGSGPWPAAHVTGGEAPRLVHPGATLAGASVGAAGHRRGWLLAVSGAVAGALVLGVVLWLTHDDHTRSNTAIGSSASALPLAARATSAAPSAALPRPAMGPAPSAVAVTTIDWCARALDAASRKQCAVAAEARKTCPVEDPRFTASVRLCAAATPRDHHHADDPCAAALATATAANCGASRQHRRHCPEADPRHELAHELCP